MFAFGILEIIDIVAVLTNQDDFQKARKYWNQLKKRLKAEGSQLVTNCNQLKLKKLWRQKILSVLYFYYIILWQGIMPAKIIPFEPPGFKSYLDSGSDHFLNGRFQEALADFNKSLMLNPHFALAYFQKGNVYFALSDYRSAIQNYRTATALFPLAPPGNKHN